MSSGKLQEPLPTTSTETDSKLSDEETDSSLLELTRSEGETKAVKEDATVPPSTPQSGISILAHKIWIGNLDKRLSQQNVLRFVKQYGTPVSFRFFFKAGTDVMEPRGYCFVEYSTREEAEKAKVALDGKRALGKKIVVDWARFDPAIKTNVDCVSETWDPSLVSETLDRGVSTSAKIAALEAKLKAMEEGRSSSGPQRTTEGRRRKRIQESRVITRPQKSRTHRFRTRGPLT